MPFATTNGIQLYYTVQGRGTPLLLVPGLGYPGWQWHRMAALLAQHFLVITPDNRGVGRSDKPAGPYSASMLAADTVGLLDVMRIKRAVVMGHSMGGFIAQAMALEYPERIDKLILASTNFGGPRHVPVTPTAMAVFADVTSDPVTRFRNGLVVSTAPGFADRHPEIIQQWMDWRLANPIEPAAYQAQLAIGLGLLDAAAAFDQKLAAIEAPTLILFGAYDAVVPPANAELLAQQIPRSEICILPDAGHFFPLEVPEEAAQVVVEFVKRSSDL